MQKRFYFRITGTVQGVGFRPFIYRIAVENNLCGWVLNSQKGVEIEVQGDEENIESFEKEIKQKKPSLARIESIEKKKIEIKDNEKGFKILLSKPSEETLASIPPDAGICSLCEKELLDKNDRRYRYPFINCTLCGPRFTIVEELPYDRKNTTMKEFKLCHKCEMEYTDPANRRFHAEPTCCNICGPKISYTNDGVNIFHEEEALKKAVELISNGGILALKGLGGFHLVVDAKNHDAVQNLRKRKNRPYKPFALMSRHIMDILSYAHLVEEEKEVLQSPESPIVLLKKRQNNIIAKNVAPFVPEYGVMLAYTPLHILLFESGFHFPALVMTSGNRQDEPIARTNEEALERLKHIADGFLLHNRKIHTRADDSIVRVHKKNGIQVLRRARGFVPKPIKININKNIFCAGAELKSSFCIIKNNKAYLSQYIGDLDELKAYEFYKEAYEKFSRLLDFEPEIICVDLHPDYLSTRFGEELSQKKDISILKIQHHEAHFGSVLAEHNIKHKALGISWDGTGLGYDNTIWGSEFFIFDPLSKEKIKRYATIDSFRLIGGDAATREIFRNALALFLKYNYHPKKMKIFDPIPSKKIETLTKIAESGISSPMTTSMGRLFDAFAFISNVSLYATFEAEGAMRLEAMFEKEMDPFPFQIIDKNEVKIITLEGMVSEAVKLIGNPRIISSRFHTTLCHIILEISMLAKIEKGIDTVCISGGVFQNRVLTELVLKMLKNKGFKVFMNLKVPPNDQGISLGQGFIGQIKFMDGKG